MSPSAQLPRLVEALRRRAPRPGDTFVAQRANMEEAVAKMPIAEGVSVESATAGGVAAEWLHPADAASGRLLVWLHGGGYVIGSLNTIRPMASHLALSTGATVLTLDYRLAPEHPYPATAP